MSTEDKVDEMAREIVEAVAAVEARGCSHNPGGVPLVIKVHKPMRKKIAAIEDLASRLRKLLGD